MTEEAHRIWEDFSLSGSAQEFVETRILGCFLKNYEFGLCDGHALGLQQQIGEIFVAATLLRRVLMQPLMASTTLKRTLVWQ